MSKPKAPSTEGGLNRASFIPNDWKGLAAFILNLVTKIVGYKTTLSVSDEELARLSDINKVIIAVNGDIDVLISATQSRSKFRSDYFDTLNGDPISYPEPVAAPPVMPKNMTKGNRRWLSDFCFSLKGRKGYTENIGKDLGILTEKPNNIPDKWQPLLSVKFVGGRVQISWRKGASDGVRLEVDRTGTGVFEKLETVMGNKYTDTMTLPAGENAAKWSYRAIYVVKNEPVGLYSTVASVTVTR